VESGEFVSGFDPVTLCGRADFMLAFGAARAAVVDLGVDCGGLSHLGLHPVLG
jgi:hypothetical protein